MAIKKKGLDISYCQKGIDLSNAKANGIEFVIVRAGISTRKDTEFDSHLKQIEKYNIPYGVYWYSLAKTADDARKEAEFCVKTVKNLKLNLPVYYDIEEGFQMTLGKAKLTEIAKTFVNIVKSNTKFEAGVYLNPSFMETALNKNEIIGKIPVWLAHWTNSPDKPTKYNYGQDCWQWGVTKYNSKDVDADLYYKDFVTYDNEPVKANDSPANTAALKKGDAVRLDKAALYGAAAAAVKTNTVSGTYYIHSDGIINNRIRITTPKGNTDCTGWVNAADCNKQSGTAVSANPASAPAAVLKRGDAVKLNKAALYGASTAVVKTNTVTGTYYVHSDGIINNRIRITTPKGNKDCTGWVNVSDCK